MNLTVKLLALLLFFAFTSGDVHARKKKQYFNQSEFEVDFNITHPVLTANFIGDEEKEILIIGEKENKDRVAVLYLYDSASNNYKLHVEKKLPDSAVAFDLFTDKDGLENVLLLSSNELSILQFGSNQITPLADVSSLYIEPKPQFIASKKLVKDLNGDGLDDIYLSDFNNINILLQLPSGEFNKSTLPIKPVIDMSSRQVSFSETRIFNVDTNLDKLPDVLVVEENKLRIYEQSKNADFSSISNEINLPMQVSGLPWWTIKGADGESADQSNLEHRMLETIEDINGDDIVDLMVKQTKSSGVLDRQIWYEIHYGIVENGLLTFNSEADTLVKAEGTLSGLELIDINNDGRKEILVSSFDIGVSQIIGALLSGSIDQDVYIFSLDKNDKFNSEPLFSEEVDLNFSLSSGSTGQPVIMAVDLNGDGLKELMLSAGEKRLSIYLGEDNAELFKSRKKRHKLVLPQDGSMLVAVDLNNDDKQEIIVRYGKQDEQELRNKIVILSAK